MLLDLPLQLCIRDTHDEGNSRREARDFLDLACFCCSSMHGNQHFNLERSYVFRHRTQGYLNIPKGPVQVDIGDVDVFQKMDIPTQLESRDACIYLESGTESFYLLLCSLNAPNRDGLGQSQGPGTKAESPSWVAGTQQQFQSSLLPPSICISKLYKPGLKSRPSNMERR